MARCAHWDWLLQSQCCPHPAGNRPNEGLRTTVHLRCVTKRKVWANQWKDHEEPWTPSLVFTSGKGTVSDTVSSVRTMVFGSDLRRDILGRTWKHVRQTSPRWKLRDTDHRRVLRTTTNVVRVMDIHFSSLFLFLAPRKHADLLFLLGLRLPAECGVPGGLTHSSSNR